MENGTTGPQWEICKGSSRGSLHDRRGLPNQDAIESYSDPLGAVSILAVSDGHGSPKSFRSDAGARCAVETALEVLREFVANLSNRKDLAGGGRAADVDLPRELVKRWHQSIEGHLRQNQPTENELSQCPNLATPEHPEKYAVVYGATLLGVVATGRFLLYLQLGDGDIVAVGDSGETVRPLPGDDRLFANETLSLCSPGSVDSRRQALAGPAGAWSEFRIRFQPVERNLPAMILVSTDGYANSFRSDADFLQVGNDLRKMVCDQGIESVRAGLPSWLREASLQSGDDVTLGIMCRIDLAVDRRETSHVEPSHGLPPIDSTLRSLENAGDERLEVSAEPQLLGDTAFRADHPSAEPEKPESQADRPGYFGRVLSWIHLRIFRRASERMASAKEGRAT